MSIFNDDNNQNVDTTQQNQNESNQSFVEELVKSRGDQWKDPEVIAKGKIEADAYIEELKAKVTKLEEASAQSKKIEDLVAKMEQAAQPASATDGGTTESETKTTVSEEDIQSLVEKTLTKREEENTARQNLDQVISQLTNTFGDEYKSVVQKKAQELGMSTERLEAIATESPSAFFTLIGEKSKEPRTLTHGSIKTEGINMQSGGGRRNNAYYQKLRRENLHQFSSAEIQNQMLSDRIAQGDAFYT